MAADFIPRAYNACNTFQANLLKEVQPKLSAWGIPTAPFTALQQEQARWATAHNIARNISNRTSANVQGRITARKVYEKAIRNFVREFLRFNSKITNGDRVRIGLIVPDKVLTRSAKPTNAPHAEVRQIVHLRHKLRITDPERPESRNKPPGIRLVQVFRFIGEAAPKKISEYQFIGNASTLHFNSKFKQADEGQRAFYLTRYENTRGQTGPRSRVASAVVA